MRFSEQWLRELVPLKVNSERVLEQLNLLGLEVDAAEPAAPAFSNVVVARIVEIEPHPDADRLRVCKVDAGGGRLLQIVCGASNAAQGLIAPLALEGAVLPNGMKIKKGKLRGVESFGMLCSEEELGLAESADGLLELPQDAPIGKNVRDYLKLDDVCIEIDLTPNRGDCLSVRGVARELAVKNELVHSFAKVESVKPQIDDTFPVKLTAPQACPRYAGRVIRGIDARVSTPVWMVEKLRRSGVRSISPAVDVTNYVMLELGQPMHAFDLNKLKGGINVRLAKDGEKLLLLDGTDASLYEGSLVIADSDGPCALAGIMGGELSAVTEGTKDIFLESAHFAPTAILGWPRRYSLHTDSSQRFERGVDPELQVYAIERATELLLEIVGGQPGPVIDVAAAEHLPKKSEVFLRKTRIEKVLGYCIDDSTVESILSGLEVRVTAAEGGWYVLPPSHRFDLNIEVDFIEELARIYGYEKAPRKVPAFAPEELRESEKIIPLDVLRNCLVDRGYHEIVSYSFIDPSLHQAVDPDCTPMVLSNPISSELSVMRTNLFSGLLSTLKYNLYRQQKQLSLFETGLRFQQKGNELRQESVIAGLRYGNRRTEAWNTEADPLDFYDIKGDVECLLNLSGGRQPVEFKSGRHTALHPGQTAEIYLDGRVIGYMGAAHPDVERALDIQGPVYLYELLLLPLLNASVPAFQAISKFPGIRRDISIEVNQGYSWQSVEDCIRRAAPNALKEVRLFDVYTGKGVTSGRKSFAIGLILQEISRTLTDEEIESAVGGILKSLQDQLGASLRE